MTEVSERRQEQLLRILIQVTARQAIGEESLRSLVIAGAGGARQVKAYNLCDGTRTQAAVGKDAGLDAGNFSRTVARWIRAGVVFRVGEGKESVLLHLYPLPEEG